MRRIIIKYLYYNNGNINKADGVVIYVRGNVRHNVKLVEFDTFRKMECDVTEWKKSPIHKCFMVMVKYCIIINNTY